MEMAEIIQIIVAILGLAGAFETFSKVGVIWKLAAVAVSGILLINLAATALARWAKPKPDIGFGPGSPRPGSRIVLGLLGLAAIAFATAALGWAIVYFYGIGVVELSSAQERLEVGIRGAVPVTTQLDVLLPPRKDAKCQPLPPSERDQEVGDVRTQDLDTQNPSLVIKQFRYPQVVAFGCSPRVDLSVIAFRPDPADVEIFPPSKASLYNQVITLIGGALWLVGISLLSRRSR